MNGKEAIINKIDVNAQAKCKEVLALAQVQADRILEEARAKAKLITDTAALSAKSKADTLYENKITVAKRKAQNEVLLAKQKILDEVYVEANQSILKLSAAEYKKLLGGLILKYAEDGDSIVPGKEDKNVFSADFITGLTANKKLKITLGKEVGAFNKGLLLSNKHCDKNLSLDMLMRVTRENSEAEVSKLCFEVK